MFNTKDLQQIGAVALCLVGAATMVTFGVGYQIGRHQKAEVAQAAYDYGKRVGHVLGSCELSQQVARENPDAEWTLSKPVQEFLTTCGPLLKKHGPGTTALIKVPK